MRRLATAIASVALLVAGCGDTDTTARTEPTEAGSSSASPAAPARPDTAQADKDAALPACGKVWRAGHRLPHSYAGCLRAGDKVAPHTRSCSSGQQIDTYGRHYYAARGAPVQWVRDLHKSHRFHRALESCSG